MILKKSSELLDTTKVNNMKTKLKAYESVKNYTIKAVKKAIKEINESINDPINISVKAHLAQRKNELENSLNIIMSAE